MENYENKIRDYISRGKWTWAKTYISCPHEYIIRGSSNNDLSKDEFFDFIKTIKSTGKNEWFGKRLNQYLYIDGYKYWTMGNGIDLEVDKTINRQKVFAEFDEIHVYDNEYTQEEVKSVTKYISESFSSQVFEVGFGYGTFCKESRIIPANYYGVDPSVKAVESFRKCNAGFYKRVSKKSFEEAVDKWKGFNGVVIALFGTASYLMGSYLKILKESNKEYFLMFYKDGYCPKDLINMHHFNYSIEALKYSFNNAFVEEYGNYYIVSTKKINISNSKKTFQYELFTI